MAGDFKLLKTITKVEKILKGSLDSNSSPSPSVKIQIMGWKGAKAKHCPAMICLYASSKLSRS